MTYEYDGLNRRIAQNLDGPALRPDSRYFYNEQWQLLEERWTTSSNPVNQYVWHPYYIDALAVRYHDWITDGDYLDENEGAHYYLQDANFNVTAVVDASGTVLERYSYTPYGEVTFLDADFTLNDSQGQYSDINNYHLYTGRERDTASGLQLNRNRYYAAHLGRWVNRDPIEYEGSGWNLYEYVNGMPIIHTDSLGMRDPDQGKPWPRGCGRPVGGTQQDYDAWAGACGPEPRPPKPPGPPDRPLPVPPACQAALDDATF